MNAPLVLENRHTGERLEISRVLDAGEECLRISGTLPPHRQGPPLHVHLHEDEEGPVRCGVLSVQLDDEVLRLPAGASARLPRGVPHRWWNDGDEELAFDGLARPVVDLDRYLQAVFQVINAGPPGRPPLFYMAHVAHRHRRTQAVLIMPPALQSVLFRLVVAVGTLLGRYRGDDWPGCPTKCPGAVGPS